MTASHDSAPPAWVTTDAGRGLFASDGCVRGNIATTDYAVFTQAKCEHVKVRGAVFIVAAQTADDAARHVAEWLRVPQNHVVHVQPASTATLAEMMK